LLTKKGSGAVLMKGGKAHGFIKYLVFIRKSKEQKIPTRGSERTILTHWANCEGGVVSSFTSPLFSSGAATVASVSSYAY
jgi:hypothetical protein